MPTNSVIAIVEQSATLEQALIALQEQTKQQVRDLVHELIASGEPIAHLTSEQRELLVRHPNEIERIVLQHYGDDRDAKPMARSRGLSRWAVWLLLERSPLGKQLFIDALSSKSNSAKRNALAELNNFGWLWFGSQAVDGSAGNPIDAIVPHPEVVELIFACLNVDHLDVLEQALGLAHQLDPERLMNKVKQLARSGKKIAKRFVLLATGACQLDEELIGLTLTIAEELKRLPHVMVLVWCLAEERKSWRTRAFGVVRSIFAQRSQLTQQESMLFPPICQLADTEWLTHRLTQNISMPERTAILDTLIERNAADLPALVDSLASADETIVLHTLDTLSGIKLGKSFDLFTPQLELLAGSALEPINRRAQEILELHAKAKSFSVPKRGESHSISWNHRRIDSVTTRLLKLSILTAHERDMLRSAYRQHIAQPANVAQQYQRVSLVEALVLSNRASWERRVSLEYPPNYQQLIRRLATLTQGKLNPSVISSVVLPDEPEFPTWSGVIEVSFVCDDCFFATRVENSSTIIKHQPIIELLNCAIEYLQLAERFIPLETAEQFFAIAFIEPNTIQSSPPFQRFLVNLDE